MKKPLVSIIMPNHNYGRFISESIQSVLNQDFSNFELLIIDNGSTDNSPDIIRDWANRYPEKIKAFFIDKTGLSRARNLGIAESRGEIITFLDSDDVWCWNYLSTVTGHFAFQPFSKVVYTNANLFESYTGRILGGWFGNHSRRIHFEGFIADKLFLHGNFIPICTAAVRREVLDEVGGFNEHYRVSEDLDLWLRVAVRHPIDYLETKLCHIRRHSANASFLPTNAAQMIRVYKKTLAKFPDILESTHPAAQSARWHYLYYEAGRRLTLMGKNRSARLFFRKSLSYRFDFISQRLWLYYPLTFLGCIRKIAQIRSQLVNFRRRHFLVAD